MRLLNVSSRQLEQFYGNPPPYAILSHTWGDEEITLQEIGSPSAAGKKGFQKVMQFCGSVASDLPQISYVWVDTCCIDKTSSAELTEAINSMFRWYRDAVCCYVYLEDVNLNGQQVVGEDFEKCRWFTRGWTLQELLAPQDLVIMDMTWTKLGSKQSLGDRIAQITGIQKDALYADTLNEFSVACRMSWAAKRETTRAEDMAYSLMGLFDINMPMLYGEGVKAFIRLQEEILRQYDDQSIFAWDSTRVSASASKIGALATHPSMFRDTANIDCRPSTGEPLVITNRGIKLSLPIVTESTDSLLGILSCSVSNDYTSVVAIRVERSKDNANVYSRVRSAPVIQYLTPFSMQSVFSTGKGVTLLSRDVRSLTRSHVSQCWLQYPSKRCRFVAAYPAEQWGHNPTTSVATWTLPRVTQKTLESVIILSVNQPQQYYVLHVYLRRGDGLGQVDVLQVPENMDPKDELVIRDMLTTVQPSDDKNKTGAVLSAELTTMLLREQWVSVLQVKC